MIRSQLMSALDFAKNKKVPHEVITYRRGEAWYIVWRGPGYCNTSRVTEFDADGLKQLEANEDKEESRP